MAVTAPRIKQLIEDNDIATLRSELTDDKTFNVFLDYFEHTLFSCGSLGALEVFCDRIQYTFHRASFLTSAIEYNRADFVAYLAPTVDLLSYDSVHLRVAAEKNVLDVLKVLLPLSDAKSNQSEALRRAYQNRNQEMFNVLYPLSDVDVARQNLSLTTDLAGLSIDVNLEVWEEMVHKACEHQRDLIAMHIPQHGVSAPPRKM